MSTSPLPTPLPKTSPRTGDRALFLVGLLLIAFAAFVQTNFKPKPQLYLVGYSLLLLILLHRRVPYLTATLANGLVSYLTYLPFFVGGLYLYHWFYPDAGWITVNGERERVMDMSWLFILPLAVGLTAFTAFLYHRRSPGFRRTERWLALIFLVVTAVMYAVEVW